MPAALLRKARCFFDRGVSPKVYAIQESNEIDRELLKRNLSEFENKKVVVEPVETTLNYILNTFNDAKEYGSILDVEKFDYDSLTTAFEEWKKNKETTLESVVVEECIDDEILPLIQQAKVMSEKYDVVVTNPPYMASGGMSSKLNNYVKEKFPESKYDFFSIFIEKCRLYNKCRGYYAMITQPSFLFLSTFEKLRNKLLQNSTIQSLLHMGRGIFGIDFGSTAFVLHNDKVANYIGSYFKLYERTFQKAEKNACVQLFSVL